MFVLDKEECKINMVAYCLENGISVAGIPYICKTTEALRCGCRGSIRNKWLGHNGTSGMGRGGVHFFCRGSRANKSIKAYDIV